MKRRMGVLGISIGVAACSGGGAVLPTAASCDGGAACGGDVVGTWRISPCTAAPTDLSSFDMTCPPATLRSVISTFDETLTFKADLSYETTFAETGQYQFDYPPACVSADGATVSCDYFKGKIDSLVGTTSPKFTVEPATCVAANGGCSCTTAFTFAPQVLPGTYSISGTTLTQTRSLGPTISNDYCVQGNTLTLIGSGAGGETDAGTPTPTTVVFSRQ
jgi:hypothetical protein